MGPPELSQSYQSSIPMAKQLPRPKLPSTNSFSACSAFAGGFLAALLAVWVFSSFSSFPNPTSGFFNSTNVGSVAAQSCAEGAQGVNMRHDPVEKTFFDDPNVGYTIQNRIVGWDEKRRDWLKLHPSFAAGGEEKVLILSGSQPKPCKNPIGDHLLLRFFKNKVDYSRIHGYDLFYNTVLLHPEMFTYWAKIPVVRAAMLAHPEAEWIWWVDSDAAFTDMDFKLPLHRYKDHNLVVHGWPELIYKKKSWVSLNAGVFLIRNCQWSLDFMDVWGSMGPQTPAYDNWGKVLRETLPDKFFPESDDQSGLVYLLLKEKEKWGNKIYLEGEYYFEGYWVEIVGTLDNITEKYTEVEKAAGVLRRRHAEKVSEKYAELWEPYLKDAGYGRFSWRRPFVTHFTGCQPCNGMHNAEYKADNCWDAMNKVLNFADNQVLRNYGYVHPDLLDPTTVVPLPFDYPAEKSK